MEELDKGAAKLYTSLLDDAIAKGCHESSFAGGLITGITLIRDYPELLARLSGATLYRGDDGSTVEPQVIVAVRAAIEALRGKDAEDGQLSDN